MLGHRIGTQYILQKHFFAGVAAKVPPVTPVMDKAMLMVSDKILWT